MIVRNNHLGPGGPAETIRPDDESRPSSTTETAALAAGRMFEGESAVLTAVGMVMPDQIDDIDKLFRRISPAHHPVPDFVVFTLQ